MYICSCTAHRSPPPSSLAASKMPPPQCPPAGVGLVTRQLGFKMGSSTAGSSPGTAALMVAALTLFIVMLHSFDRK